MIAVFIQLLIGLIILGAIFIPLERCFANHPEQKVVRAQFTSDIVHFFANFLLDNIDLVRQLEDAFRDMQHVPLDPILSELERKAQHWGV